MDTSREIKEDSSFNMTLLILVIGLVGIGGALLLNNIPLFGMIIALPLLCITCILLLKYPWFILFVIFTINYFILGITRYIPIEGVSVIMDILYVTALVLLSIHAALYTFVSKQTKTIITSSTLLLLTYVFFALTTIGNSNATIRRMRTAFTPTEDASFNVRKENQKKLASYMKYKPFGEGLGLSGDRAGERISKRFTTSIPTDSWYVKIWVETGAVGLTLYLSMIFLSIGWGGWIIAMRLRDPELKGLLTGLLCGIFGMFINAYGNSFWGQFPTMVISFTGLTFIMVGPYLDQEIQEKKSTDSNIKHHD